MNFDPWLYTRDSLIEQLTLIELHGKDGSAVQAGCKCIQEKHIVAVEGLSKEGVGFAKSDSEKHYYMWLADFCREQRKKIDSEDWSISAHGCPPCPKCEVHKHGT